MAVTNTDSNAIFFLSFQILYQSTSLSRWAGQGLVLAHWPTQWNETNWPKLPKTTTTWKPMLPRTLWYAEICTCITESYRWTPKMLLLTACQPFFYLEFTFLLLCWTLFLTLLFIFQTIRVKILRWMMSSCNPHQAHLDQTTTTIPIIIEMVGWLSRVTH